MKKGSKHTKESLEKISKALKGRVSPQKDKKLSEESKKKISESLMGHVPWNKGLKYGDDRQETKDKISKANKNRAVRQETRDKISKIHKNRKQSIQQVTKRAESIKDKWKEDREFRSKMLNIFRVRELSNISKYELLAKNILDKLNVDYEQQKIFGNKYIVDFYIPSKKLIIEINGYQHKFKKEKDLKRQNDFIERGYNFVRLNEVSVRLIEEVLRSC